MIEEKGPSKHYLQAHGHPITRRQFLAAGLASGAAAVMCPSLYGLTKMATPGEVPVPSIPFLIFDCVGGAAFPGSFLVGKSSTDKEIELLPSYSNLGWNPLTSASYTSEYGLPIANVSQMLAGLNEVASVEARANLRMGSFCHFAQDDSSSNPLSPLFLLSAWGYRGTALMRGTGVLNSLSGGNSEGILPDPTQKAIYLSSVEDLIANIKPVGPMGDLPPDKVKLFFNRLNRLTLSQVKKYENTVEGQTLSRLLSAASAENLNLSENPPAVDPRLHAGFKEVYQLEGKPSNDADVLFASVAMGSILRTTGPGVISIPNCDYHSGTPNPGETVDAEIGRNVGRAVEMAHRLKTPIFFCLITDGGISADSNTRNWRGDAGDKSMTVIGYYDPNGASKKVRRLQAGRYTAGQSADLDTLIGRRPDRVACAVFGNYLNVMGKIDDFDKIVPQGLLSRRDLEDHLIFG